MKCVEEKIKYFIGNYYRGEEALAFESTLVQVPCDEVHRVSQLKNAEIEKLRSRKCSHGEYEMVGTTDCAYPDCFSGRVNFYVLEDGYCVGCQNKLRK